VLYSQYTFFLSVYFNWCTCTWACELACTCAWGSQRTTLMLLLGFLRQDLSSACSSAHRLGWLAEEPQGSTCLLARVKSINHHAQLFFFFLWVLIKIKPINNRGAGVARSVVESWPCFFFFFLKACITSKYMCVCVFRSKVVPQVSSLVILHFPFLRQGLSLNKNLANLAIWLAREFLDLAPQYWSYRHMLPRLAIMCALIGPCPQPSQRAF
jgi:hypothetical protein